MSKNQGDQITAQSQFVKQTATMTLLHNYSDSDVAKIKQEAEAFARTIKPSSVEVPVILQQVQGMSYGDRKEGETFSHWAVIVGPHFYYHLVFDFFKNGEKQVNPQGVIFQKDLLSNLKKKIPDPKTVIVGSTRFSPALEDADDEILIIGKYLITKFGKYHRIFWNCQHFAKILCLVLTGTVPAMISTTDFVAGYLFRFHFTNSLGFSMKLFVNSLEGKVLNNIEPEFKEIIEYEKALIKAKEMKAEEETGKEKETNSNLRLSCVIS